MPIKIFEAAIIGSMYVVLMLLFPNIHVFYTVISKIVLSILIVFIAFSPSSVSDFFKTICVFYVSTFILAGSMLFFVYLNKKGSIVKNGVIYMFWNFTNSVLVMAILTVCLILKIVWSYIKFRSLKEKLLIPICINFDNKDVKVNALLDTGASLSDPFSDLPIIVVEFGSIRDILPLEIQEIFKQSKSEDLSFITNTISNSKWVKRFRVIPFNSLGNKNGMLIGFKADNVSFCQTNKIKEFSNVIIAIYDEVLTNSNSYSALIGLELYNK